ncbi:MAG TPA: energy transducer TonB [Allosphingosinicella sp.]|jgi:protein TonB
MRQLIILALTGALIAGQAEACDTSEEAKPARAKANLTSLFSDQDYPAEAVAARQQGSVAFALDVGANGRVTDCTVTASSGSAALDATTCRLIASRALFTPATDARGATVPDHVRGRIVWVLPPAAPAPAP